MEDHGAITNKDNLQAIISTFPEGIDHAFGYGSGVFVQEENNINTNQDAMIDLIMSVSDETAWHEKNLYNNPDHYAAIPKLLGSNFVSMVQNQGAGCYFNPMVRINTKSNTNNNIDNQGHDNNEKESSRLVKYGVISHDKLKKDLMEWDCMYVAGRMHKPVLPLEIDHMNSVGLDQSSDEILQLQQDYNLRYAVSTALLLLPLHNSFDFDIDESSSQKRKIDISHLFESIAGLSYIGDPRLAAGAEDPGKVQKLVNSTGQLERFKSMYSHQMSRMEKIGLISMNKFEAKDVVEVNLKDGATRRELFNNLPKNVQLQLGIKSAPVSTSSISNPTASSTATTQNVASEEMVSFAKNLAVALGKIVGPPARVQSAKGVITAGIYKSFVYAGAKLAKGAFRNIIKK
jgi:translocator assembly and maintenance protein 41